MHKFPISNYSHFAELPFDQLDKLKFSIYIVDFDWNYLFVNDFARRNLKMDGADLIGKNMWEVYPELQTDPNFVQMRKNSEIGIASNIITISPVTQLRINIKDYRLEDSYYFSVSILPNKENLMDELRDELEKNKLKNRES